MVRLNTTRYSCARGNPLQIMRLSDADDTIEDADDMITGYTEIGAEQDFVRCT